MAIENLTDLEKSGKFEQFHSLKAKIHRRLIERLDFTSFDLIEKDILSREISRIVEVWQQNVQSEC